MNNFGLNSLWGVNRLDAKRHIRGRDYIFCLSCERCSLSVNVFGLNVGVYLSIQNRDSNSSYKQCRVCPLSSRHAEKTCTGRSASRWVSLIKIWHGSSYWFQHSDHVEKLKSVLFYYRAHNCIDFSPSLKLCIHSENVWNRNEICCIGILLLVRTNERRLEVSRIFRRILII